MKYNVFVRGHLGKWPPSWIFDWPIWRNGFDNYRNVTCQLWCLYHNLHDSPQECMMAEKDHRCPCDYMQRDAKSRFAMRSHASRCEVAKLRSCVARSCDAYREVTMRSTMRSAMLHRIVTSRLRIAKRYFAKRFRNASWALRDSASRIAKRYFAKRFRNASWALRMRPEDNFPRDIAFHLADGNLSVR